MGKFVGKKFLFEFFWVFGRKVVILSFEKKKCSGSRIAKIGL
jgi:hypothetical protein